MSMKKETPSDVRLHWAAVNGDVALIRRLLDSGKVHVDCRDKEGTTPLVLSAANGHFDCVLELLEQGADPTCQRVTGTTALFFAAQSGYTDVADLLLKNGAKVDTASVDGGTPLFVSCQYGHLDTVTLLLDHGAKVNSLMKDGASPLFIASQNGYCNVAELLVSRGAEIDQRRLDGATPLWIASQMNHPSIVRFLLKFGANVNTVRRVNIQHPYSLPIEEAISNKERDVHPISIIFLVSGNSKSLSYSIDNILHLFGFSTDCWLFQNGESALHAAVLFGHARIVRLLLLAGAPANLRNQEGATPLDLAIHSKNKPILELLCHHIDL
ncbi:ankyrin repeat domain-containing protein 29 [Nilaparvata lugens]|uniref:ankyrin repeat domain-containing protein 29 n=1 Tax=Nilaparvata lugens TaxID=108931 RepID=UPI00193E3F65|nr:ankyrin repeat domain-containing protein 29 [Nilaparvata lugens]